MAKEERVYNIPLRKDYRKAPRYKRVPRAISSLRDFLTRHMKATSVKIGKNLNLKLWERGIRKPPHHVKVTAVKEDDGVVKAELYGFKYEEISLQKAEEKKEAGKKEETESEEKPLNEEIKESKKVERKPEKVGTEKKPAKKKVSKAASKKPEKKSEKGE